jgi:HTH-type transcriptional repressor of NAD biosynthesis genes
LIKIAIMGAAQSGKTQLSRELTEHFSCINPVSSCVFFDAPALMAALVAHQNEPDLAVLEDATARHQVFDLTLICGLDLGLTATTMLCAQEAQDAGLRNLLTSAKLPFSVVYGRGRDRLSAARRALRALNKPGLKASQDDNPLTYWHTHCENCSDPVCERALFTGLLKTPPY